MKLRKSLVAAAALALFASPASADELELSGNAYVFMGYQHDDSDATGVTSPALPERGATAANRDTFNFYVDEFELDIQKSWDIVKVRADLDFGRAASGSNNGDGGANTGFELEQAYVGFNIADAEVIVGRFNAPIGVTSVDRVNNVAISYPYTFSQIPTNVTGAKVYYAFSDMVDLHAYVINNFNTVVAGNYDNVSTVAGGGTGGAIPSGGLRLGINWGEEGQKSTVGFSGVVGGYRAGFMRPIEFIGDLDFSWYINEQVLLQGEFMYKQRDSAVGGVNSKLMAAFLLGDYVINDQWDVYARYDFRHDIQGAFTGSDHQGHAGTIGVGYNIAEGAKFKLEYRLDFLKPAAPADETFSHAVQAAFGYTF